MNEPPIGHPDTFSVNFSDVLTIDNELDGLLKYDVDSFYCDVLSVEIVRGPSLHLGPFSLNPDGTFTYTHNGTFDQSQDTIIYRVYDGEDFASENDTVYINIILPPPTTATVLSLKKNPSHVAHADTPKPLNFFSDSKFNHLACAPVEIINESAVYFSPPSPIASKGFDLRFTDEI